MVLQKKQNLIIIRLSGLQFGKILSELLLQLAPGIIKL